VHWYDRQGKMLGEAGEGGIAIALSPDATRAAITNLPEGGSFLSNVWLLDLSRGAARTRFSFGSGADADPIWSADGGRIAFASRRPEGVDLIERPASGAGDERLLLHSNEPKSPTSWSSDGRYMLFTAANPRTNNDVWVLPVPTNENARKPTPLLSSEFNESHAFISPDSRWVAYISDESGRNEAYVRPFTPPDGSQSQPPRTEGKTLVSTNGAETVRWRRDGRELFYEAADGTIMAVEIAPGSSFQPSTPQRLFQTNAIVGARYWDVSADGKRFLVGVLGGRNAQTPFTVILNWPASLSN
jgi:Tol biopolymer transport system component